MASPANGPAGVPVNAEMLVLEVFDPSALCNANYGICSFAIQ